MAAFDKKIGTFPEKLETSLKKHPAAGKRPG
jgi:hypothetical protein